MSEQNDKNNKNNKSESGKKTLSLKGASLSGKTLSLSRSTRSVVVEKRTRRVLTPSAKGGIPSPKPHLGAAPVIKKPVLSAKSRPDSDIKNAEPAPEKKSGLTESEAIAREKVLREAAKRQNMEKLKFAEEEKKRALEAQKRKDKRQKELEQEQIKQATQNKEEVKTKPEDKAKQEKETKKQNETALRTVEKEKEKKQKPIEPPILSVEDLAAKQERMTRGGRSGANFKAPLVDKEELERARKAARPAPSPSRRNQFGTNTRSKLTITSALSDGGDRERAPSLAAMKRRREKQKNKPREAQPKVHREVILPEVITVQELANRMSERSVDVIKLLMQQGQMATINDVLDADTAELIATELGHTVKRVAESDVEEGLFEDIADDNEEDLEPRPPVVTIMGHVDHGKTSLLDAIREANVVSSEAGGITQHIGAYQVEKNGQIITFLDTPGHEAFTAMRARGAQATDIAVLVVAADDSVMPQTIESIKHAKAANIPIIIAINKIDKANADPNKVRTELLQHEIVVESMGGDVLEVEVSALKKINLDKLLENILLQAELLELKANPKGRAQGIVIEAKLDKGRGAVATALVQRGILRVGDIVVAGSEWARVRALINDKGEQVKQASPSTPVEILGFSGVPKAGDRFSVVKDEAKAREITEYRKRSMREKSAIGGATSLEQMMDQLKNANIARFPLIIKADVQGSVEAISAALEKLTTDEVSAQILMAGVGGITESDVTLAQASKAVILGFNVRANKQAREAATRENIEIRYYNIIYDLVDDIKGAMSGLLAPERRETFIGYAKILEIFNISKIGKVAGCLVTEGIVERGSGVRLLRDDVVIHEGELSSLKRFKDEVKEVQSGQECGMAFANYQDIRKGDIIECFRVEQIKRTL